MKRFTVNYFIEKFSKIPDELWLVHNQGDEEIDGSKPHCAIGWCKNERGYFGSSSGHDGDKGDMESNFSREARSLSKIFYDANIVDDCAVRDNYCGWNVAHVNNGNHPKYQQATPKERILAALLDCKSPK